MRRLLFAFAAAALLLAPSPAQAQSTCQFVLGFQEMSTAVDVGTCVDNQSNAANGDALQHTTKGMLVWRKVDNWTAFTDGYRSWINGPSGLQSRLNTELFDWEQAAQQQLAKQAQAQAAAITAQSEAQASAARAQAAAAQAQAQAATQLVQQRAVACLQGGNVWLNPGQQIVVPVSGGWLTHTAGSEPECFARPLQYVPRPAPTSFTCTSYLPRTFECSS